MNEASDTRAEAPKTTGTRNNSQQGGSPHGRFHKLGSFCGCPLDKPHYLMSVLGPLILETSAYTSAACFAKRPSNAFKPWKDVLHLASVSGGAYTAASLATHLVKAWLLAPALRIQSSPI